MEQSTLKSRQPAQEDIECWDDDEDLQGIDDLQFRNVSSTTNATHRESISSRASMKSDRDSIGGAEEDWQVLLPADDEVSTTTAIASAKSAGIPIPANVPTSALLGGTIKRLGGRKLKKVLGDDWSEDLEIPKIGEGGFQFKKNEANDFPEAIRQISAAFSDMTSPSKPQASMSFRERMESVRKSKPCDGALDKFQDDEDEEDFFGDVPTLKIAKNRSTQKPVNFAPPPVFSPPTKLLNSMDDFEDDLEFPADGQPLKLSARKEIPKTPASQLNDDFDTEWAEGSLGTRFGGTRRDGRSNPSSSISALSPSVSSCLTAESEDEGLDGLILPDGPLKFDEVLKKRLENASPDPADYSGERQAEKRAAAKEDFFAGIEIGDGDVFDSGKLTLNRNIKHKTARQTSPARRTAMTLTFTNKPLSNATRIPVPKAPAHDRSRSRLEPVSESGGPVPKYDRSQSRMAGHSKQSSTSSIPTPSTPSSSHVVVPSTPSRRTLNNKSSRETLNMEPTTNVAQLLRAKRSIPAIRSQPSPARVQPSHQRPPSRGDYGSRQAVPNRPKTPVDRSGAESSLGNSRRPPVPFLPAGTSHAQSHHISTKSSRNFHRPTSSDSNETTPLNRPISRLSNHYHRSHSPSIRKDLAPEALAREASSKRTLTKPTRRRAFGDGTELEIFDDLPTSATIESRFVKQPVARGAPKSTLLRSKLGLTQIHPSTPSNIDMPLQTPQTPLSPTKHEPVPRFARDTNASRIAREQRVGCVSTILHASSHLPTLPEGTGPLTSISTNWKAQVTAKGFASPSVSRIKRGKPPPQKPCLIKPLGDGVNSEKSVKGMHWNPTLFRWEGNENALAPFDALVPPPYSPKLMTGNNASKPAPALIANFGAAKGVQVSGGMVFDPQRMCWLKMAPSHLNPGTLTNPTSPATVDEDEDPFAGLEDLDDGKDRKTGVGFTAEGQAAQSGSAAKGGSVTDDWLVGEEFDVGPEFVRRQRAEEEKWRRKVEGWVGTGHRDSGAAGEEWKWAIRGIVPGGWS
ncbi:hypothetical protein MMC12_006411 [Toensbergia leucococca]|nr:hypothetical protein [Toensbergia leucococca]